MRSKLYVIIRFRQKALKSLFIALGIFWGACSCITDRKQDTGSIEHLGDKYDFTDSMLMDKPEVAEAMLVDYLAGLPQLTEEEACGSVRKLVAKYGADDSVSRWLLQRLEHHLYEPDSPIRNDNYYISVLEEALVSGRLNGMMRVRPLYQLKMLKKNRTGDIAADFSFTLPAGELQNLWGIPAQYTLLLFYDPDCMHCLSYIQQLSESPVINSLLQRSEPALPQLALVAICTESDMDTWWEYQNSLPSTWVNGYDARSILTKKELYFLRSLPSLFLLGADKQVLLKEPSSISEVTNYLLKEVGLPHT